MVNGYDRLIDQPDRAGLTAAALLDGHRSQTLRRLSEQDMVLLIQDGADITFATHHGCEGLDVIGRNGENHSGTLGFHVHSTYAVNAECVPLRGIRMECDAPDGRKDKDKPLLERPSGRWIRA